MALDDKGIPQPTGQFETLQADAVVLALGQQTDSGFLRDPRHRGEARRHRGRRPRHDDRPSRHLRRRRHGAGRRTVTIATGHGKKAARHIDGWLRGRRYVPAPKHQVVGFADLHLPIYSDAVPFGEADVPAAEREGFAEVVGGLSEAAALHEAQRCLSCGNCFECDNCFAACPETAIVKLGPTHGYRSTWTLCTGCAVCVEQCPCHAMEMVPETAPARTRERALMSTRTTMDGNTAVAHVAYRVNEVCAIFPITPSSTMADLADQWTSEGLANIWGNVPVVQEMQARAVPPARCTARCNRAR